MSPTVFFVVLCAALLHAVWNAMIKGGLEKDVAITAISLGHALPALVAILLVPAPDVNSYPYIALSILLHGGYQLFLMYAYSVGDLTQVYPIARGAAPLIVMLVSVTFLAAALSTGLIIGAMLIVMGILALGFRGINPSNRHATFYALGTSLFIAAYSIIDGIGARASDSPIGYFSWIAIGNAIWFVPFMEWRRKGTTLELVRNGKIIAFFGGGASFLAYAMVTWAFTQAPIALVTALRETSIIFAMAIGVIVLKEPLTRIKILSIILTCCGVVMLRMAG